MADCDEARRAMAREILKSIERVRAGLRKR
jgi:hypothetical protein